MMTDANVLDTIPQEGAERAMEVFNMMRPAFSDPRYLQKSILAMARAILAWEEWKHRLTHEERMLTALQTAKVVKELTEARLRYRRDLSPELAEVLK